MRAPTRFRLRVAPVIGLMVCAVSLGDQPPARAGETSGTNFPLGVNTAAVSLWPPAGGTEYYNYDVVYSAGRYKANSGNPNPPNFRTFVFVEAARFNHTWINLTPDVTLGSGFALNGIHQTLRIGDTTSDGGFQFMDPDLIVYNLNFRVSPHLWLSHIFNIFPGWGQYSRNKPVNGDEGFTTYAPELTLTYLPSPAWEVDLDAWVGFNTKNHYTDYQSGHDFNADYLVGYRPLAGTPSVQLGVNGYIYQQWADDTLHGARVGDGNRGRVFAVGPQIRYDIGHGGLIAKWQHELAVENRSQGNRFWVQFAIPL